MNDAPTPPQARKGAGAWIAQHRVPLGVAGAVAVALLAYTRSRSKGAGAPAGAAAGSAITAGGQTAGMSGGGYDSTGSDVYNALEPMLEGLTNSLAALSNSVPVPAAPPPSDVPTAAMTPAGDITSVTAAPVTTSGTSEGGSKWTAVQPAGQSSITYADPSANGGASYTVYGSGVGAYISDIQSALKSATAQGNSSWAASLNSQLAQAQRDQAAGVK